MSKSDRIPLTDLDRPNPMIWEGDEPAEGVFLNSAVDDELALLGTPSVQAPRQPRLPEDFKPSRALRAWLAELRMLLAEAATGDGCNRRLGLNALEPVSRQAALEILGEGEVCGEVTLDGTDYTLQESVLTGVWNISASDGEAWVEVNPVPSVVSSAAESLQPPGFTIPEPGAEVMNAPAVLSEVHSRALHWQGEPNHVINFTLLPMSEADHELIRHVLGRAALQLHSGGFGECRVMATTVKHVWAVQYVNAMGHTILDTLEIGTVPTAARASREDFEDSAERLGDILQAYLA